LKRGGVNNKTATIHDIFVTFERGADPITFCCGHDV